MVFYKIYVQEGISNSDSSGQSKILNTKLFTDFFSIFGEFESIQAVGKFTQRVKTVKSQVKFL